MATITNDTKAFLKAIADEAVENFVTIGAQELRPVVNEGVRLVAAALLDNPQEAVQTCGPLVDESFETATQTITYQGQVVIHEAIEEVSQVIEESFS